MLKAMKFVVLLILLNENYCSCRLNSFIVLCMHACIEDYIDELNANPKEIFYVLF